MPKSEERYLWAGRKPTNQTLWKKIETISEEYPIGISI